MNAVGKPNEETRCIEESTMNYYYITGSSRGIGKAIAESLLKDEHNVVHGLSRGHDIHHANYQHHTIDLSNPDQAASFTFEANSDAGKIVLINNAGTVGELMKLGALDNAKMVNDYHINLVSPSILINNFINTYHDHPAEKQIINISSGAGKTPIDTWSVYCAAKAGLDMFSRVLDTEQDIAPKGFKVFSVDPGIVDTQMQTTIRSADQTHFSRLREFIGFKDNGNLASPERVAEKYVYLINHPEQFDRVMLSVTDIR
jgi:benzil reductase ((S)-benzoin forming)